VPEPAKLYSPAAYEERALREALDAGITPGELKSLLRGRHATDLVAPSPGEEPGAYADRAASEFLLLYLGSDLSPT
jgi:hypothetical protein